MRKNAIPYHAVLVLAVSLAALTGCGTVEPRSFVPKETKKLPPFPGVAEIAKTNNASVRIFLIHGISHHDVGWATNTYLNPIVKKLGWHFAGGMNAIAQTNILVSGANPDNYAAKLTRYTIDDGDAHRMVAYEFTWSPLVDPFKTNRFKQDDAQARPYLNQVLRDAIDERLADAVLYMSKFDHDIMARSTSEALEIFYSGELDDASAHQQLERSPVIFISESLGSKMLFDAVTKGDTNVMGARHHPQFRQMIANNELIFMMANQLPLLDMPEPGAIGAAPGAAENAPVTIPRYHSLRNFINAHGIISNGRHLTLVAFTDLYDDLSWKLSDADLGVDPGRNVKLYNFTPINAINWFGIMESPSDAHTGYGANEKVVDIVVNGYRWKQTAGGK